MSSDVDLLIAWRSGDRDAGDALLGKYFEPLCRFFRSKLDGDVDDLVQRTFLDCVEARDRVRDGGFRSYVYGVARNRLADHLRGRLRREGEIDLDDISIADLGTSPSQALLRSQEQQLLLQALRTLAVDDQIALELTYWEGLLGEEVAAVLGVEASTVRSRLTRARSRLRAAVLERSSSPPSAETTLKSFFGERT